MGKMEAVKSLEDSLPQSSPWSFAIDKYLALPKEGKDIVTDVLQVTYAIALLGGITLAAQEGAKEPITFLFKLVESCL